MTRAMAARAGVIVMDDGLQNPSLVKTVALVVLDGIFAVLFFRLGW